MENCQRSRSPVRLGRVPERLKHFFRPNRVSAPPQGRRENWNVQHAPGRAPQRIYLLGYGQSLAILFSEQKIRG